MVGDKQFVREWFSALLKSDRGLTFLCNLSCDVAAGRIASSELDAFLHEASDDKAGKGPFERIDHAVARAKLLRRGPRISKLPEKLSTIRRFDRTFCDLYLDARRHHGVPSYLDDSSLFEYLGIGELSGRVRAGQMIRGQKPLVWLTPTDALQAALGLFQEKSLPNEIASRVRDFLGLNHYSQDDFLIHLLIPSSALESSGVSRPLSWDAGANLIFRTDANDEEFGSTVDLATSKRGAKEVVSDPIPIEAAFEIAALGRLDRTPAAIKWRTIWSPDDKPPELEVLTRQVEALLQRW